MGPTVFQNANYDFIGKRYIFLGISAAFMAACLGSIFVNGMNLGVEFTGGAQLEVNFDEKATHKAEPTIEGVRKALDESGLHNAQVVTIGSESDHAYLIRVQALTAAGSDLGQRIEGVLRTKFGEKLVEFDFDKESLDRATLRVDDPSVTGESVRTLLSGASELQGIRIESVEQDKASGGIVLHLENAANDALLALEQTFGKGFASSIDSIGAAVSKDLQRNALLAIAGACVLIAIYVWLRFDWDFAPGVVLSLSHDAIAVIGIWSLAGKTFGLTGFEFNLTIVAAVLAIIGYSVNDTVVIYDRIRENRDKYQGKDILWIVNKSVNETLSRTVLTSGATMLSVLSIALLGSESIRWFGWAMVVGLISGTWSTIAVAIPVTMLVYQIREKSLREAGAQPHVGAKG